MIVAEVLKIVMDATGFVTAEAANAAVDGLPFETEIGCLDFRDDVASRERGCAVALSKSNPVTYGVDAIRQVFLGSDPAAAGLGVTVFDRTMGLGAEVAMVSALGLVLIAGAVLAYSRQE